MMWMMTGSKVYLQKKLNVQSETLEKFVMTMDRNKTKVVMIDEEQRKWK